MYNINKKRIMSTNDYYYYYYYIMKGVGVQTWAAIVERCGVEEDPLLDISYLRVSVVR